MTKLYETISLMVSDDYKERFKAEYYQTKIRLKKLDDLIEKYNNGKLEFELDCPIELLMEQDKYMYNYLRILKIRANTEHIEIEE